MFLTCLRHLDLPLCRETAQVLGDSGADGVSHPRI
jgi:hypothetical protein